MAFVTLALVIVPSLQPGSEVGSSGRDVSHRRLAAWIRPPVMLRNPGVKSANGMN